MIMSYLYVATKFNQRIDEFPNIDKFDPNSLNEKEIMKRRDQVEESFEVDSERSISTIRTYNELQDMLDEIENSAF